MSPGSTVLDSIPTVFRQSLTVPTVSTVLSKSLSYDSLRQYLDSTSTVSDSIFDRHNVPLLSDTVRLSFDSSDSSTVVLSCDSSDSSTVALNILHHCKELTSSFQGYSLSTLRPRPQMRSRHYTHCCGCCQSVHHLCMVSDLGLESTAPLMHLLQGAQEDPP